MTSETRLYYVGWAARAAGAPMRACPPYGMVEMRTWWRRGWRDRNRIDLAKYDAFGKIRRA